MIDLLRMLRAVHLDTQPQDGGVWQVTGPENSHLVTGEDSELVCDCRDFTIRGGSCKHILRVGLATGDSDTFKALRRLLPNPSWRSARHRTRHDHPEHRDSRQETADRPISARDVPAGTMIAGDSRGQFG